VAVIRRVCDEAPRPIREVNPDVPEPLCRVIERLHAKRPADRFQTAAEVADLLSRHLAQLQQPGIVPREPLAESLGASVPPRKPIRVGRRLAACAALVALGVVAACWIWWRPDGATGDTAPKAPPASARALPAPKELARRAAPADALRREDIRAELLQMAGGGDKDHAPPELVAVFGEDRHAAGDMRNHLNAVAIRPDGKTLAFGGTDTAVRLVSLEGQPGRAKVWDQPAPEGNVESLAFSPDGKVLACAKANGLIRLWDVAAGAELPPLGNLGGRAIQIAFSPDARSWRRPAT
jgi:hypothetical protein